MNYGELKSVILSDSHRSDYTDYVAGFVARGEALIASMLDGYILDATLNEASRVVDGVYTLPARVTTMRSVITANKPLGRVDEVLIYQYRTSTCVTMYCMRDTQIVFAGIPGEDTEFSLNYYGMPAPLVSDEETNNLLTDYPQLYIESAQVYLFKRARNLAMSEDALRGVGNLIRDINRKTKKKLGGAQAANGYNVCFRSSY